MKFGIIVCTRMDSNRLPNKCAININGKSVLEHLHSRLRTTKLPVIYAYPYEEYKKYDLLFEQFEHKDFLTYEGFAKDPLKRMYVAAYENRLDAVIRVTHDKIFLDPDEILRACKAFELKKCDYLFSNKFTDGTSFEIISTETLKEASNKFNNVEHITYAIKAITTNQYHFSSDYKENIRLLIDYPEDLDMMNCIFSCIGNNCSLQDVYKFLMENPWALNINKMPKITVYTCAYNADKWIFDTIMSVIDQHIFHKCEYILIDDYSTDKSPYVMNNMASCFKNIKYIRNNENIGLSSSSNIALKKARGKYIVRLDADDYFTSKRALEQMYEYLKFNNKDAVYPNNYYGSKDVIQLGNDMHHIGGTMFKKSALDHLRFTDGLRHHDSFDVFTRAKNVLNIGYYPKPLFFYTQHANSMSKSDLELRKQVHKNIEVNNGYTRD